MYLGIHLCVFWMDCNWMFKIKKKVEKKPKMNLFWLKRKWEIREDGGEIGGSRVHFPLTPVKHLADLRSRVNSQRYSSIYEDRRPKMEDIERSDSKKSA